MKDRAIGNRLLSLMDKHSLLGNEDEGVSKSFRTGRLAREMQMIQLSATRCSCVGVLWASLVSFASITLCVASHPVFVVYFVIDSVRKLLDTPSCPLGCVERQVYEMGPTQPLLQWIPGALSLGVKRLGREAGHSPASSAEVREWVELYLHSPNTSSWCGA
jgi:hypothetical protein